MWVKFFSHHTLSATVCFVIFLLYVSSYYGHPIGQATIFCSCFFFLLDSFFFLACSQQSQIGYRPYFHTWCGLSVNLECSSLKIQDAKICHLRTIAQLCRAMSSQLRHISTIGKNLLNSNISSKCPHNTVNFSPLTAEIDWWVWGIQQISMSFASWLRCCTNVAEWRSTKLCMMFGCLLGWYTTYTFLGALAP